MDQGELLGVLREETLPRLPEARLALDEALAQGSAAALGPVRELCHRIAGTGALAGQPALSRLGYLGEAFALLALEGDAKVTPRLVRALGRVLEGLEAELAEPAPAAAAPAPSTTSPGRGGATVGLSTESHGPSSQAPSPRGAAPGFRAESHGSSSQAPSLRGAAPGFSAEWHGPDEDAPGAAPGLSTESHGPSSQAPSPRGAAPGLSAEWHGPDDEGPDSGDAAPRGAPSGPEAETAAIPRPGAPSSGTTSSRGAVALVSEEAISRKLLTRVLEGAGFEVTRVALGEALPNPTEVLVLDVPTDESLGPALEALLTAALGARLGVVLAGKAESPVVKALAPRASQLLPKPVVPEALEAGVRLLVARRRMAAAARAKAPTAQVPAPPGVATRGLKVLIVDDSRVIRGVVREALQEVGLVTFEAEDGAEALRVFERERPDAVISDLQMPGLDGAQLTRLLRERGGERRIPIVVLSALDDEPSRQAGLAAGADAWLVKKVIDGPALLKALEAAGLALGSARGG